MAGPVYVPKFTRLQPHFKKIIYILCACKNIRCMCVLSIWRPEKHTGNPTTAGDKMTSSCEQLIVLNKVQ